MPPSQTSLLQVQLIYIAEHKHTYASAHSNIQVAFLYFFFLTQRTRCHKRQGISNQHNALRWLSFCWFSELKIYHFGGNGDQHSQVHQKLYSALLLWGLNFIILYLYKYKECIILKMFSNNQSSKISQKLRNTDIKTLKSLEELKSTSLTLT